MSEKYSGCVQSNVPTGHEPLGMCGQYILWAILCDRHDGTRGSLYDRSGFYNSAPPSLAVARPQRLGIAVFEHRFFHHVKRGQDKPFTLRDTTDLGSEPPAPESFEDIVDTVEHAPVAASRDEKRAARGPDHIPFLADIPDICDGKQIAIPCTRREYDVAWPGGKTIGDNGHGRPGHAEYECLKLGRRVPDRMGGAVGYDDPAFGPPVMRDDTLTSGFAPYEWRFSGRRSGAFHRFFAGAPVQHNTNSATTAVARKFAW